MDQINNVLKHVLVTLAAIIIAALGVASGYVPAAGLASVLWKFVVTPVIAGAIAYLTGLIQHNS